MGTLTIIICIICSIPVGFYFRGTNKLKKFFMINEIPDGWPNIFQRLG
jgi:hypothetical protein